MVPRSLRWQLTLVFTGVVALVVLAAAVGTAVLFEQAVWAPIDAAIEEEAETLVTIRDMGRHEDLTRAVTDVGRERDTAGGKFVRVTDHNGRVIAQSGDVPWIVTTAPSALLATLFSTVRRGRESYRLVTYPSPGGGRSEVGVLVTDQVQMVRRTRFAIGVAAAAMVTILGLLAWSITARATAELARLAAELETIEAGSVDRRLAPRRTSEVDRLATVLNRLLGRLEGAMGHLRRFTADAAHELRTPIAAVRAHLEVALGRPATAESYRNGLLDGLEQIERLGQLADSLLTLSAVESGPGALGTQEELVRLDVVAREVAESLQPLAEDQGRRIECRLDDAIAVRGVPELFKRLVLNLVGNALRHTPSTAWVCVSVVPRDGTATIEVSDGGPGIPPEELPLIFERFRHGANVGGCAGLGLALCREIVTRHRGNIALCSTPGAGTTVTVTLPLANGTSRS